MKTHRSIILAAVASFFAGAVASLLAQEPGAITLEECLRQAEAAHPSLEAAQAAIAAASQSIDEARAYFWPQVDLGAGYHRWQKRAFLPSGLLPSTVEAPAIIGPLDDWNAGVTARAVLFDFGERRAGVDASIARRDAAAADAASVRADLRLAVRQAFFTLAAAREMEAAANQAVLRTQANLRLAEARQRMGAVPQADVLRAQGEEASARLELIAAEGRTRTASGRLNVAMGRPAEVVVVPAVANGGSENGPAQSVDVSTATDRAMQLRSELVAARRARDAAEAAVRAARAGRSPKVRADAAFGWRDVEVLPETEEWQAGVSVDYPLFDGGARRSRVARAEAERARAEASVASLTLRIREEVWSAVSEVERAQAALALSDTLVEDRAEAVRVVRARYEAGAALITDLIATETALTAAEAQSANARWQLRIAEAVLTRAAALDTNASET